jgi:hypothetical protein
MTRYLRTISLKSMPMRGASLQTSAKSSSVRLSRRPTFTLLNGDPAAGSFSAFFHGAHSAFGLRPNAEASAADDHTDARRRGPFLDDPAPLRGRLLNDVVVRKARRNDKSCQSGSG